MPRKVLPLSDRILVKPLTQQEVTKSGLVLPDTAQEKPQQGTVIAVGPGRTTEGGKLVPMDVKVGNVIMFAKFSGAEWKEEGEDYLLIREPDILARIS